MAETTDPREVEELNRKIKELQEKLEELKKTTEDAGSNFGLVNKGLNSAKQNLLTFTTSLESTEKGFAKYNSTLAGLGDTALELGKSFGILGTALGTVVKSVTFMVQKVNEQNDRIANAFDKIAEVGTAARLTAGELRTLGTNAGLSSQTLMLLSKNAAISGSALVSMAGSAGEGAKSFSDFIAVGDDQLIKYRKLGFSQEAVIEAQTKYLQQTVNFGVSLNKPVKDLQKESLRYLETLVALSDITGNTLKEQQDALDFATSQMNFNQYVYDRGREIQRLKENNEFEAAALIEKELESKKNAIAASAKYDQEYRTAILQSLAGQDTIMTERVARYVALYGVPLDELNRQAVQGKEITTDLLEKTTQATERFSDRFGNLVSSFGDAGLEISKTFGQTTEMNRQAAVFRGRNLDLELENTRKGIEAQTGARDQFMAAYAALESTERKLRIELDNVIAAFNPLLSGFDKAIKAFGLLALAAFGASVALQKITMGRPSVLPPTGPGAPKTAGVPTAGTRPIPGGMNLEQYERYQELRRQGMTAQAAMRQSGGFGAYTIAEDRIRAAQPAGPTPPAPPPTVGQRVGGLANRFGGPVGAGVAGLAVSELGGMVGGAAGAGLGVAGQTLSYAAMGSMIGPWGALAGGIIGLTTGLVQNTKVLNYFSQTQQDATEATSRLSGIYQSNRNREEQQQEAYAEKQEKLRAILGDNIDAINRFNSETNLNTEKIEKLGQELNLNTTQITNLKDVLLKQPELVAPPAQPVMADTSFRETPEELKVTREEYREKAQLDAVIKGIDAKYKEQLDVINRFKEPGERITTARDLMTQDEKLAYDSIEQRRNELTDKVRKHEEYLKQENIRINLARQQNELSRKAIEVQEQWFEQFSNQQIGGISLPGSSGPSTRGGARRPSTNNRTSGTDTPQPHGSSTGEDTTPQLTTVTSNSGKSASVNIKYKDRFQNMIDWLENEGYDINTLQGYNNRDVTGQPGTKSAHAYGAAIDINPGDNPYGSTLKTNFPDGVGQAAAQFGLGWGGNWTSVKDAMHFSMDKKEGGIGLSDGGIAVGPKSGYPVTLHGTEAVIPLNSNSLFEKIARIPADNLNEAVSKLGIVKNEFTGSHLILDNLNEAVSKLGIVKNEFTGSHLILDNLNQVITKLNLNRNIVTPNIPDRAYGYDFVKDINSKLVVDKINELVESEKISKTVNSEINTSSNKQIDIMKELAAINLEMKEIMAKKFDDMIDKLGNSNSIQERLLKTSIA